MVGIQSTQRVTGTFLIQLRTNSTSLVFLKPEIKLEISRRELVPGDHYFGSVSDVLSKIARGPGLLVLNQEEVGCSIGAEQREWT
ncbi:hypothetical protein C2S53_006742 [Perilla frutescens var. hirtella]|uniref:DUF7650 domain-containing protein n=1 Tax=Perilla frutescens var. hirtella TaxID=608512 RepID=A0AAD4JCN7_PERFH|nr:hypothetical protein C2S53_006742 [Perilla frutescens var. hirtella]